MVTLNSRHRVRGIALGGVQQKASFSIPLSPLSGSRNLTSVTQDSSGQQRTNVSVPAVEEQGKAAMGFPRDSSDILERFSDSLKRDGTAGIYTV